MSNGTEVTGVCGRCHENTVFYQTCLWCNDLADERTCPDFRDKRDHDPIPGGQWLSVCCGWPKLSLPEES